MSSSRLINLLLAVEGLAGLAQDELQSRDSSTRERGLRHAALAHELWLQYEALCGVRSAIVALSPVGLHDVPHRTKIVHSQVTITQILGLNGD